MIKPNFLCPFMSVVLLASPVSAQVETPKAPVSVADFGALPNDGKDDTAAIVKAVESCHSSGNPHLVFPTGQYDVSGESLPSHKRALFFDGLKDVIVDGNGSTLMCRDRINPFFFKKCERVLVKNLTIDWARPYFSQGKVLQTDGFSLEVAIDPEYPVTGTEKFEAVMDYDPATRLPLANIDVLANSGIVSCELIRPQVLRLTLKKSHLPAQAAHFEKVIQSLAGKLLVLRHAVYGNYGLDFISCKDVTVENVSIYSVPGMGLHAQTSENLTLRKVGIRIRPNSGRLMSTTADCQYYTHCSGTISIEDSYFEGMGDDGLNITGKYKTVTKIINPTTMEALMMATSWQGPIPTAGQKVEFVGSRDLKLHGVATIKVGQWNPVAKNFNLTFTEPLPPEVKTGDFLTILDYMPKARIRNCTFRGMRSRALLFSTRDIIMEDCKVEGPGFAGIMIMAGARSHFQGPSAALVIIRRNVFEDCGGAAIYSDASVPAPSGAHREITIEDNTIRENPALRALRLKNNYPNWVYWTSAICLTAVDGAIIRNNTITGYRPALFFDRADNVQVSANKFDAPAIAVVNKDRTKNIEVKDSPGLTVEYNSADYDSAINYVNILR